MFIQRVVLRSEIDHLISSKLILLLLECLEGKVLLVKLIGAHYLLETLQVLVLPLRTHD